MKNNQYKPIEKIYIVQELKQPNQTPLISEKQLQAPVRKSLLSKAARGKIVNQNSSYQSLQGQESYGPCIPYNDNCHCGLEELQRQEQILKNRRIEEQIKRENNENNQQERNRQGTNQLRNERDDLQRIFQELQIENRNVLQTLGINNLSNLPTLLNGENLSSLLNRPTQQQLQNEQTARQTAEQQRNQVEQELQRRTNERDEARGNLQTIQQQLIQTQNDLNARTTERDERPNISIADYNQLNSDYNRLNNLEAQKITELVVNLGLVNEQQWFKEIEKKVKSLKKLAIFHSPPCNSQQDLLYDYRGYHFAQANIDQLSNNHHRYSDHTNEWKQQQIDFYKQQLDKLKQKFEKEVIERLQKFIDQNTDLTHLNIQFVNDNLPKEPYFDFSRLPKLVFLSTPITYDKELNLKNNKELEYLWFTGSPFYNNDQTLDTIDLKENKKLKCLAFDRANLYSLNLMESKDLEYIDIRETKIGHLDLRNNPKITARDKDWNKGNRRCFRQEEPWNIEEWFKKGVVSHNMEDCGQQIKKQDATLA